MHPVRGSRPGQRQYPVRDIDRLEQENFAWIDFQWSTLLTSTRDTDALVSNLVSAMTAKSPAGGARRSGGRWTRSCSGDHSCGDVTR
jgi:hypothetical protein